MTTFSVPTGSYTISSDYANAGCITGSITIPGGSIANDVITISNGGNAYSIGANVSIGASGTMFSGAGVGGSGTYTISGGAGVISNSGAISGGIGAGSEYEWTINEEFVDCLPNISRINDMCKQYPGLQIAFEKFKTVYKLVKDDYDTPEDKRTKP
jgi:hypothetical protein